MASHFVRGHKEALKRRITGFHEDDEGHWVAELECGHQQHMRHHPPLFTRLWVLTDEGRQSRVGMELNCKRCDEEGEDNRDRQDDRIKK